MIASGAGVGVGLLKRLYRERNRVERFFGKLKHFRRIDTRYGKLAENFLYGLGRDLST